MSYGRIQRGKEFLGSLTSQFRAADGRMSGTLAAERLHLEKAGLLRPDQTLLQYSLEYLKRKAQMEKEKSEKRLQQEAQENEDVVLPVATAMLGVAQNA